MEVNNQKSHRSRSLEKVGLLILSLSIILCCICPFIGRIAKLYEGGGSVGAAIQELNAIIYLVIVGIICLVIGLSILYWSVRLARQQQNSESITPDEIEE